ncbi:uncharacterized protein B0I36DRAFT_322536 [Microdochium trichocladiopsis]|uniref:Secreted protein n=1 Tax=Microdochium trichocladiopsis TaxID=1682393 RepID=A0A9P8Y6F3_9PEZI|nr:uncharacterized protein B0I36DRAFT_322536 [Microdochium trichocladiopsis]KAH7030822.1 hypothetical protein B0I36DRAFT_322536 [Microdochium trichocladiopsis]
MAPSVKGFWSVPAVRLWFDLLVVNVCASHCRESACRASLSLWNATRGRHIIVRNQFPSTARHSGIVTRCGLHNGRLRGR